jgi:hypothetical protein
MGTTLKVPMGTTPKSNAHLFVTTNPASKPKVPMDTTLKVPMGTTLKVPMGTTPKSNAHLFVTTNPASKSKEQLKSSSKFLLNSYMNVQMGTTLKNNAHLLMIQYPTPALEEQLTFLLNQSELLLDNRTRTTLAQTKVATAQHDKNQPNKTQQNIHTKNFEPQRQHPTTMVQKSHASERKGAVYNSKIGPQIGLEHAPLFDSVILQVSIEPQLNVPIQNLPLDIIRPSTQKLFFFLQGIMMSNAEVAHELITSIKWGLCGNSQKL